MAFAATLVARALRVPAAACSAAAAAAAGGVAAACQQPPAGSAAGGQRASLLSKFGAGDIPSEAYKAHFSAAHDEAAAQSASNVARRRGSEGTVEADGVVRRQLAGVLMRRIGYTDEELELLGDDVLRMQGVRSPFRAAALQAGEVVVDLGSGFGPDAFLAAAKVGPFGSVVGVNLSAAEVGSANDRARNRGLAESRCRFVVADMESTPLPAGLADVVISNGGFCLCPDKEAAFREVHRILRPGGRLAISCTVLRRPLPALEGKRWPPCMEVFMPRSSVECLLQSLGFRAVTVDEADSRMDVWEFADSDLESVAQSMPAGGGAAARGEMCSYARKAAAGRARDQVENFLARDREAGIHWGNPEFKHVREFDMNEFCARVTIYAEKCA